MDYSARLTTRLRHAGPVICECKPERESGVASSRKVRRLLLYHVHQSFLKGAATQLANGVLLTECNADGLALKNQGESHLLKHQKIIITPRLDNSNARQPRQGVTHCIRLSPVT